MRAMMSPPTAYRPFESARESLRHLWHAGAPKEQVPPLNLSGPVTARARHTGEAGRRDTAPVAPPKVQAVRRPLRGRSWRTSQVPMTDGEECPRPPHAVLLPQDRPRPARAAAPARGDP